MYRSIIAVGIALGACLGTCSDAPATQPPSFRAETGDFPGGLGVLFTDDQGERLTLLCYDFRTYPGQECNTDLVVDSYIARFGA